MRTATATGVMMGAETWAVVATALLVASLSALVYGVIHDRRNPADSYLRYEKTLADMQTRLEKAELRGDRQQEQIDRLRESLVAEQDYNRALARAMRDAGLEPPPRPEPPPAANDGAAILARNVAAAFSIAEIDDLAMELQIDAALTGDSLENRASSLVKAAMRRGKLSELIAIARRDRPRGGF